MRDSDIESYDEPPDETLSSVPELVHDETEDAWADRYRVEDARGPERHPSILGAPGSSMKDDLHASGIPGWGLALGKLPPLAQWLVGILAVVVALFLVFLLADHLLPTPGSGLGVAIGAAPVH